MTRIGQLLQEVHRRSLWQLLRLGSLYDARDDVEPAVRYYSRLISLWSDADGELQPILQDVHDRVARLTGARG